MVSSRTLAILPAIWLGTAATGSAQGFNAPGDTPPSSPPMGMASPQKPSPLTMPGQGGSPYPQAGQPAQGGFGGPPQQGFGGAQPQPGFGSAQPQPGFGGPPPGRSAQQPARQNYAEELTDFGVPPQSEMQPNVASPTPTTIPGGHVITTAEMRQAVGSNILFVDVLAGPPHPTLPGALWLPGAGNAGSFNDDIQQKLWSILSQATQQNPDRPIVFFCAGSKCWESYNAALRAEHMGFKMVLWYRGGLAAWQAAGLPVNSAGGGGAPPQQGRMGFGGGPQQGSGSQDDDQ